MVVNDEHPDLLPVAFSSVRAGTVRERVVVPSGSH
jgi:hypothetical protein